jgi:hypothetical protein
MPYLMPDTLYADVVARMEPEDYIDADQVFRGVREHIRLGNADTACALTARGWHLFARAYDAEMQRREVTLVGDRPQKTKG